MRRCPSCVSRQLAAPPLKPGGMSITPVIPVDPLSADEVRERADRHHLAVAFVGDTLIGCSTMQPPAAGSAIATVIVRVLPEYRHRGRGAEFLELAADRGP
jgi:hypothetical protein